MSLFRAVRVVAVLLIAVLAGASPVGAATIAAPIAVSATRGTVPQAVRVSWLGVSNAATYRVYSTAAGATEPKLLMSNLVATTVDIPVTSVTDAYYFVVAVAADGTASLPSGGAMGFPGSLSAPAPPVIGPFSPDSVQQRVLPFVFMVRLGSTDRFGRAGQIVVTPYVSSVPAGDTVRGFDYYVNGAEVARSGANGRAVLDLPAGKHTVRVQGFTTDGASFEVIKGIELAGIEQPVCDIDSDMRNTGALSLRAVCSVKRGAIVAYRWEVNGVVSSVTGRVLNFRPQDVSLVKTVTVTGFTDQGLPASATYQHVEMPKPAQELNPRR